MKKTLLIFLFLFLLTRVCLAQDKGLIFLFGPSVNLYYGDTEEDFSYSSDLLSWQVNGQLGLISKRGEKNRRNMFGLFASGGTTKPGALKLMQKDGDPSQSSYIVENKFNEFFTVEAGMVISGCLRFSGGVGRQYYTFTVKEVDQGGLNISRKKRGELDYFSGTLGLIFNLDAVNWVVDANFMTGRDLNKSELRFSTGFMLKF